MQYYPLKCSEIDVPQSMTPQYINLVMLHSWEKLWVSNKYINITQKCTQVQNLSKITNYIREIKII